MSNEFPKVPPEAKSFNDMVAWAAKHGQADSVQQLLDAAKTKDWDSALDAVHKLEDFSEMAETAGTIGKHLDAIDKIGKAVEIAQAAERGDYLYAGTKLGAEVVDQIASGYLDGLGPGGIMLNYAVHQGGEVMSGYVTEAQQFGPDAELAEASAREASVAAYKNNKEFMEREMREQLDGGRLPADVQQWARDHMEAHGAIYRNLEEMQSLGNAYEGRFEKDLDWAAQRSEALAEQQQAAAGEAERPAEPAPGGLFDRAWDTLVDKANDLKEAVVDRLDLESAPETAPAEQTAEASEPKINEPQVTEQPTIAAPAAEASVEYTVEPAGPAAQSAVAAERVAPEAAIPEPAAAGDPTAAAEANPMQVAAEAPAIEIPLPPEPESVLPADQPVRPTEVVVDLEMTETDRLDAYVSKMAREAEAQWAAEALADEAPPPATEVNIYDAEPEVYSGAPINEHASLDQDAAVYELAEPAADEFADASYEPATEDETGIQ